jgi:formamidase
MGDMHAGQGDGEIAGHTMDVSGSVTLQVEVIKNYPIDGPVLFPLLEDLPPLAKPFSASEKAKGLRLAEKWGVSDIEPLAPISVVGTAANLNDAIDNGLERAAKLLDVSVAEIRNRATVNGAIEIGRAPGVIQVTFLAPLARLDAVGLGDYAREQYDL